MRRFIDFHTHSTASDGVCAPAELVALAERSRLAAVVLTDHDTVAGLAEAVEAAMAFPSLRLIGGIEISAMYRGGTMHLLGLGLDVDSPRLAQLTADQQAARAQRDPQMLAKLHALGVEITMDDVLAAGAQRDAGILPASGEGDCATSGGLANGTHNAGETPASRCAPRRTIGRMHFAQALIRKGYVHNVAEAFRRYLGFAAPAYVDKERLTPAGAIEAIHASGGLAVLAHPVSLQCENRLQLERVVRELAGAGLDGVEAYHSDHDAAHTRMILDLARRLGLGVTGGSDFHGLSKPHVQLGQPPVPLAVLNDTFRRHLGL